MTDPDTVRGHASVCDSSAIERIDNRLMTMGNRLAAIEKVVNEIKDEVPDWFLRHYFRGDADAVNPRVADNEALAVTYNGNDIFIPCRDRTVSGKELKKFLEVPEGERLFEVMKGALEPASGASATEILPAEDVRPISGDVFFSVRT